MKINQTPCCSLLLFLILVVFGFSGVRALAGGSVGLDDLRPLLNQQPKLWKIFETNFDIAPGGWGDRIGAKGIFGSYSLAGTRIAPYHFDAKPKGTAGPYNLEITIEADPLFTTSNGRPAQKDSDIDTVREVLTRISVGLKRTP